MELLTDDLRARLPPLYAQEAEAEPDGLRQFFLPGTGWTWYVMEGEPAGGRFLFFGFVVGTKANSATSCSPSWKFDCRPSGLTVERDLTFTEGRLTDVVPAPDL